MESIKIGTEAKNGSFTDDGQVDLGVARLRRAEIDPTPVETLVALLDVGDDERGRLAVDAEGGALAEHLVARPVLGGVQVGVSRVHAASKHQSSSFIVKSAILRFINRYIYISIHICISYPFSCTALSKCKLLSNSVNVGNCFIHRQIYHLTIHKSINICIYTYLIHSRVRLCPSENFFRIRLT